MEKDSKIFCNLTLITLTTESPRISHRFELTISPKILEARLKMYSVFFLMFTDGSKEPVNHEVGIWIDVLKFKTQMSSMNRLCYNKQL